MEPIEEIEPYRISKLAPDIMDLEVLRMIQAGFSIRSKEPLTIIQRSGSDVEIIPPIEENLNYSDFCKCLKKYPFGKERCDESDRQEARVIFKENIQEPYPYFCHVGLNCLTFPIVVEGKTLAVFLSGKRWDPGYAGVAGEKIEILEREIHGLENERLDEKLNTVRLIDPRSRETLQEDLVQLVGHITKLATDRVQSEKGLRQRQFLNELKRRLDLADIPDVDQLQEVLRLIMKRVITFSDLKFALLFVDLPTDRRSANEEVKQLPLVASAGVSKQFPDNLQLNITDFMDIFEGEPCIVPQLNEVQEENNRQKLKEVLLNNLPPHLPIPHEFQSENLVCVLFKITEQMPAAMVLGPREIPADNAWMNLSARDGEFLERLATELGLWIHVTHLLIQLQAQVEGLQNFMKLTGHDLKGHLQAIRSDIGYLQELFEERYRENDRQYDKDEQIHPILETIDETAGLIDKKLDNFQFIANLESGQERAYQFRPHPLGRLIQKAADQFKRKAAERDIEIIVHPDVFRTPRVELDWDRMFSAFTNLIENAVKYSHANKKVEIHGNQDGDYVEVTVGDYGLGIPESDYELIFEPHQTSSARDEIRSIEGMGIGLAVVKEVVEQHKGKVWVKCSDAVTRPDDYQGRLVIFTVRLPLTQSGG